MNRLTFSDWLLRHKHRDSPIGDLARDVISDITNWRNPTSLDNLLSYLMTARACDACLRTAKGAWEMYERYSFTVFRQAIAAAAPASMSNTFEQTADLHNEDVSCRTSH